MKGGYRLGGLDDVQLLASLSALVRSENESLADLLAHLAELDDRELCIALGKSAKKRFRAGSPAGGAVWAAGAGQVLQFEPCGRPH